MTLERVNLRKTPTPRRRDHRTKCAAKIAEKKKEEKNEKKKEKEKLALPWCTTRISFVCDSHRRMIVNNPGGLFKDRLLQHHPSRKASSLTLSADRSCWRYLVV